MPVVRRTGTSAGPPATRIEIRDRSTIVRPDKSLSSALAPASNPDKVARLRMFEDFDFSVLDDPSYKEDAVREDLVAPLLKALGYQPTGKQRMQRSQSLITHS
jgi:hypothetical protein